MADRMERRQGGQAAVSALRHGLLLFAAQFALYGVIYVNTRAIAQVDYSTALVSGRPDRHAELLHHPAHRQGRGVRRGLGRLCPRLARRHGRVAIWASTHLTR